VWIGLGFTASRERPGDQPPIDRKPGIFRARIDEPPDREIRTLLR
jgi:hypothetical protein